jgi:hypothetical protein
MKRIAEIKAKRENKFIKDRIKSAQNTEQQFELDKKEVEKGIDLVKTPSIAQKLARQKVKATTTKMEL